MALYNEGYIGIKGHGLKEWPESVVSFFHLSSSTALSNYQKQYFHYRSKVTAEVIAAGVYRGYTGRVRFMPQGPKKSVWRDKWKRTLKMKWILGLYLLVLSREYGSIM